MSNNQSKYYNPEYAPTKDQLLENIKNHSLAHAKDLNKLIGIRYNLSNWEIEEITEFIEKLLLQRFE